MSESGFRHGPGDPRTLDDTSLPPSPRFYEAELDFTMCFSLLLFWLSFLLCLLDVSFLLRHRDFLWLDSLRGHSTAVWSMRDLAVFRNLAMRKYCLREYLSLNYPAHLLAGFRHHVHYRYYPPQHFRHPSATDGTVAAAAVIAAGGDDSIKSPNET